MSKMLMSRAGSAMAAVYLLRPISGPGYYPVPYSACVRFGATSRIFPWLCVNLSTKAAIIGIKNAQNANRRVSVPLPRFRAVKAATMDHAATNVKQTDAMLRKGILLEFRKESGTYLLAVIQKPDGKRNWIAADQFGNIHVVRPQQVTFIVPGTEDFNPADIGRFVNKVDELEDKSLLEFAWEELVEARKDINVMDLAKICYGEGPVECYAAHRLLISQQIYFRCKQKGPSAIYEPRLSSQVNDLRKQQLIAEAEQQQLLDYVHELRTACQQSHDSKPPPSFWQSNESFRTRTECLKAYGLELSQQVQQKKCAEEVLELLKVSKKSTSAVDVLIKMGVFPVHVNLELLKSGVPIAFSDEQVQSAQQILADPFPDTNLKDRVDLTHLKIYTIDSEDADEIDDGLSAVRLPDGRIKVWIHVADPTRWVPSMHMLDKEAKQRSTSIYLPTETIPMFPMELATSIFSLRQGHECCAISVSVIFRPDGSMAESEVVCSTIRPTYRLSYDSVAELLLMHVEEEAELYLLAEVAKLRQEWRTAQGAIDATVPEANIKVTNGDTPEPSIQMSVVNQGGSAARLVSELMIACGEALAVFGEQKNISLPYRGQSPREIPRDEIESIPEGPCRAIARRRYLGRADMSFTKPIMHAALGVSGYVQFTSPIRRYSDLLAHYQVKAVLRGELPPFSSAYVEAVMAVVNLQSKQARKLQSSSTRYWGIEYLRRQPQGMHFQALVLRFLKEREPVILIEELGIQANASISSRAEIGSEITVAVDMAHPRKDVLLFREVHGQILKSVL